MGIELATKANKLKTQRPREWIMTVQTNMTSQINEPNKFDLHGIGYMCMDTQISYTTTSLTGKPTFNYTDLKGTHNFTGDGIRTQKTEIGMLVTVLLEAVPDFHAMTLTLLVPTINLDGSARKFKTIAIQTTSKDTIAGESLVKGTVQSYEVVDFQGTANSVMS